MNRKQKRNRARSLVDADRKRKDDAKWEPVWRALHCEQDAWRAANEWRWKSRPDHPDAGSW